MGYARKDVEKTKKIAKKFVRYQEGAELVYFGDIEPSARGFRATITDE